MAKQQSDWTLPVVLILIGCIVAYFLFLTPEARNQQDLLSENARLLERLHDVSAEGVVTEDGILSALKVQDLEALSDAQLRERFGAGKDFCVTFETESGDLFPVKVGDDCYTFSFGMRSVRVRVGDATVPCGYRFNSKLQPC